MIAPKANPATPHAIAIGTRPSRRPVDLANSAPATPTSPHATICHGVHGPWPKKRFDDSAATAPTTNPGAPPSTYPAISTMSVVGLTFGSGANAIRPSAASAASVATSASTRLDGCVRSYHAKPATSVAQRIRDE